MVDPSYNCSAIVPPEHTSTSVYPTPRFIAGVCDHKAIPLNVSVSDPVTSRLPTDTHDNVRFDAGMLQGEQVTPPPPPPPQLQGDVFPMSQRVSDMPGPPRLGRRIQRA